MTSNEIRKQFLEFFKSKQHEIVASAPMVQQNDPTLMFVNAGMVPFKSYFLGQENPKYSRIANSQKCLRVSGKHNDLEEVGKDTYHHTLFEMLGNWSFGDYFKKEAIAWAWELLTQVYKINKENLYVTVFEGDDSDGLAYDQEAYDFWKVHIPEDRIINGNKKDNFWEMGAQGPCGPCSEIHIDIRSEEEKTKIPGKQLVNQDHPQVVEIWNLVFMEFNRKADGQLEKLKSKHIDTGMGFERLCMVMQNVQSNYDTDVFTPIITEIERVTNKKYNESESVDIAIRVVADHVRAVAFSIADGQLPSNNGAGYVIRRILRRAIRYGYSYLNAKEPFIYKLEAVLCKQMGEQFPEIIAQQDIIANVIREEEQSFLRTISNGIFILENHISGIRVHTSSNGINIDNPQNRISGKVAFELYDTYGFPIDLTQLIASEHHLEVDIDQFNSELQLQKQRSRAASEVETDDWMILLKESQDSFIGYDNLQEKVRITRYRKVNSKKDGIMFQLVFDKTPFYPEGGGQAGDKGHLIEGLNHKIDIIDTKKENGLIIHFTKKFPEDPTQIFTAVVNEEQRSITNCNHSATHLLHAALRKILGNHVSQKGSSVNSKGIRFDFSHFSKLTEEQVKEVENLVNEEIAKSIPLNEFRNISMQEALDKGALAFFGEKYGEQVRAIQFGDSIELCGGTHVKSTQEIWYFKVMNESAIAAGIRRIEAITGEAAKQYFTKTELELNSIKKSLKNPKNLVKAVGDLQSENNLLKKQLEKFQKQQLSSLVTELSRQIETLHGVQTLIKKVKLNGKLVKELAFQLGEKHNNIFLFFGYEDAGKAGLACYISKELAKKKNINANNLIKELSVHINGSGGGQPFFASAGGANPQGIETALLEAKTKMTVA